MAQVDGKGRMKASTLDRSCSLAKLEGRLGPYAAPPERSKDDAAPKKVYRPKPGFLARALHIRNWKDYLLAEAHKDALALAIILTYKELFHMLDEATTPRRQPKAPPRTLKPALATWLDGASWKAPAMTWLKPDLGDMDLKADDAGRVLYPFRDDKGHVWAIRAMDGQGRTADIGDLDKPGLSYIIDPGNVLGRQKAAYDGQVVITSDCLAAAILYKDAGVPVIVVPTDTHLVNKAVAIRKAHPKANIVIATTAPRRQAEQAASVAAGTVVVIDSIQAQTKIVADLAAKGHPVAVDPNLAKEMGTFEESALSPSEAKEERAAKPVETIQLGR